jgi:MipA family protein
MFRTLFYSIVLLMLSTTVWSSENQIAESETSQDKQLVVNPRDGGYFSIGAGYFANRKMLLNSDELHSEFSATINARYQQNGFFIEFPGRTTNRQNTILSFGYNFLNTEHWSFDGQIAMNHPDITYFLTHQETGKQVEDKRVSHSKLGIRAFGTYEDIEISLIAAGSSGKSGPYLGAWLTRNFQYKNLSFHTTAGAEYRSKGSNQFFYGSNENHNEYGIDSFQASSGIEWLGEVGVEYPISEKVFVEGFIRGTALPEGVRDSPFVIEDGELQGGLVLHYVF